MPAVARANGTDVVLSPNGTGKDCAYPLTVATGPATQERVTVEKIPAVVAGDVSSTHFKILCKEVDNDKLVSSSRVSVGGKQLARIGDLYKTNVITSGSSRVFAN